MREDRIAIGLLALLVIATFANVVFFGKSLVPSEQVNPLDYRINERNYGPDFVPASVWHERGMVTYPNYRDHIAAGLQMEPSREFLRRSLLRGEFPFWDPYIGGGNPAFASLVPAYLFPPTLVVVLLGNGSLVKNVYILLLILTCGVLTYFLLRRHGLGWQASLAGGAAFAFSGAMIQTAPAAFGQPVALFALPLIVAARLIELPSARRASQLALAFAFVALASFPPMLAQTFGLTVLYVIVSVIVRKERRAATAGWFAAGAALGLILVAVVYVPSLAAMNESTHIREGYRYAAVEGVDEYIGLAQLLSPSIMGGSAIYINSPVAGATGAYLYCIGVVALILGAIGLLAKSDLDARILKIAVAVAGTLSLLKIFRFAIVNWIIHVPVLRSIHYSAYFGIVVAFAAAVLAALGLDALIRGRARLWQVAASGTVMAAALVLLRVFARGYGVDSHPQGWRWIADFRLLVVFAVLTVALTLLALWRPRRRSVWAMLILAVLAFEAITNNAYPRPRRWDNWRHPVRYVEILMERNTGGRVLPLPFYAPNVASVFEQPSIDSLTLFTSPRMFALYQRHFNPQEDFFLRGTRKLPPDRILDFANIEYVALNAAVPELLAEAARRGYETLHADGFMHLVRRSTPPRYSFTSDYTIAASAEAALDALPSLPANQVVLETRPSFPPSGGAERGARTRLAHFSLNEVEIAVDAPRAGFLVCSESHMRGWSATVDGRPAPILAANYAFRAVEVPAGSHVVRLRYRAPGFLPGLLISAGGVIVCWFGLRRRRPALPPQEP